MGNREYKVLVPGKVNTETMKIIATKAQRHQGFFFNKTLYVTLCLCVLVANFKVLVSGKVGKFKIL
jgi:hypothetical protein